ncbi:hypothetical protein [Actinoplanes solisilvae]|uniref:hypothetical protein n=1 Tax=Actinoplanes solisilvae TaxID=2486853 RepID=UPI000FD80018|nr:hypothetical protein [Actinoplanes solisilvae]
MTNTGVDARSGVHENSSDGSFTGGSQPADSNQPVDRGSTAEATLNRRPEPSASGSTGAELPPDVQRVANLTARAVKDQPANGLELLTAVFKQRFGIGVKLKGANPGTPGFETGSTWLFERRAPGWRPVGRWRDVKIAARLARAGGLTLFASSAGQTMAAFIHNGRDGVLRVVEAHLNGTYHVTEIDRYEQTHAPPDFVAAVDHCGEVHG